MLRCAYLWRRLCRLCRPDVGGAPVPDASLSIYSLALFFACPSLVRASGRGEGEAQVLCSDARWWRRLYQSSR